MSKRTRWPAIKPRAVIDMLIGHARWRSAFKMFAPLDELPFFGPAEDGTMLGVPRVLMPNAPSKDPAEEDDEYARTLFDYTRLLLGHLAEKAVRFRLPDERYGSTSMYYLALIARGKGPNREGERTEQIILDVREEVYDRLLF